MVGGWQVSPSEGSSGHVGVFKGDPMDPLVGHYPCRENFRAPDLLLRDDDRAENT